MPNKDQTYIETLDRAHQSFLPLIRSTYAAIGTAASRSYFALRELAADSPAKQYPDPTLSAPWPLKPRRTEHVVSRPPRPKIVDEYLVSWARTEAHRLHAGPIPLRVVSEFVSVAFHHPPTDKTLVLSYSRAGSTEINGSTDATYPRNLRTPRAYYDPNRLVADYVHAFGKAIRVAQNITRGLVAYGIEGDEVTLTTIRRQWDDMAAQLPDSTPRPRKSQENLGIE